MDPDVALEALREACRDILDAGERTADEADDLLVSLIDRADDLRGWLRRGGFVPKAWKGDNA